MLSFMSYLDDSLERKLTSFSDYWGQGCHLPGVILIFSLSFFQHIAKHPQLDSPFHDWEIVENFDPAAIVPNEIS